MEVAAAGLTMTGVAGSGARMMSRQSPDDSLHITAFCAPSWIDGHRYALRLAVFYHNTTLRDKPHDRYVFE